MPVSFLSQILHQTWFRKPRFALYLALGGTLALVLILGFSSHGQACDSEASRMSNGHFYFPTSPNPDKMAAIKEAGVYADIGHAAAREMLARAHHENITEFDVVQIIEKAMVDAGADESSFETIVASGEDSAIPHGNYDDDETNLILPGEVIVIDLGARVDGWASDETRTYVLTPVPENFTQVYNIAKVAHDISAPMLVHGTQAWTIDKKARDHIRDEGYGDYFIHSLGHGVGACVHERPLLSQRNGSDFGMDYDANRDIASVADVVTIEPGIYLPEQWGIRIEDDYRVYDDKSERYTHSPDNLSWAIISAAEYDPINRIYKPDMNKFPDESDSMYKDDNDDGNDENWGLAAYGVIIVLPLLAVAGYRLYKPKP